MGQLNIYSINQLNEVRAKVLRNELVLLDKHIDEKIDKVIKMSGADYVTALEYVVTDSPILLAKLYVNWEARDYQYPILM